MNGKTKLALWLFLMSFVLPAFAVKTDHWELKTPADFTRGKLHRLAVGSDGDLRLGYGETGLGEFAREIWCSTVAKDGTIYFGTGSPADVYAVGADGKATKVLETESIAVTAMAVDSQGNVFAATMAEGKVFKITPGKEPKKKDNEPQKEFCRLRAPYIWALAVDKQDRLFAGTGPDGKVYRIGSDGKAEEWFASEETNLLSLAIDESGALLAGGSDRGLLYRVAEKGKGTVLHEFGEDEVKSLVVRGPTLYVGVNRQKVKRRRGPGEARPSAAEFEDITQRLLGQYGTRVAAEAMGGTRETPPQARLANLLAGAVYVRNADGRIDKLSEWENESLLDMTADRDGGMLVAMAGSGRVYRVSGNYRWELLFDFDEQHAMTLATRDGRLAFVGTGNVGTGHLVDAERSKDGEFLSEVHDCRFLTTWGNLTWMGDGAIQLSTRTGNTALPDATWSDWSASATNSPGKVGSPRARFIQVRSRLAANSAPALQTLRLYFQVQNQKPEIAAVVMGEKQKAAAAKPKPGHGAARDSDATDSEDTANGIDAETEAATSLKSAVTTALQGITPERKTESFRPKEPSSLKRASWTATDQDGDTLVYRLHYQANDTDLWIPVALDKPMKNNEYLWNTESIPDGWYRLKVVASDEESNPAGEALTDERTSESFKVDNRRPEVAQLAHDAAKGALSGVARDNLSLIAFLEYAVDGGEWRFFVPKDGVFDDREEAFEVKIEALKPGAHSIAVRATDEDGNVGVEKIAVRVP